MIANLRDKVLDKDAQRRRFPGMPHQIHGSRLDPRLGRAASDFIEKTIAAEDFIGISAISLNVLQEVQLRSGMVKRLAQVRRDIRSYRQGKERRESDHGSTTFSSSASDVSLI